MEAQMIGGRGRPPGRISGVWWRFQQPQVSVALTWAVLVAILSICATQAFGEPPSEDEKRAGSDLVRQVIFLYESGRLEEAEHLSLKTLDAPGELTRLEQSELYLVLAFCSIANDDEENGRRHFVSTLKFNPNLKPDPIGWSPKVRRVFDRARAEWIQIAQASEQRELSLEAELCRKAVYHSLLLPGSGQIYKDQKISGWVQGALFWGGLATSIYAQTSLPALRDKYRDAIYPDEIQEAYNDYRNMSRLVIVSTSFTVTVYGYSMLDALWRKPNVYLLAPQTP